MRDQPPPTPHAASTTPACFRREQASPHRSTHRRGRASTADRRIPLPATRRAHPEGTAETPRTERDGNRMRADTRPNQTPERHRQSPPAKETGMRPVRARPHTGKNPERTRRAPGVRETATNPGGDQPDRGQTSPACRTVRHGTGRMRCGDAAIRRPCAATRGPGLSCGVPAPDTPPTASRSDARRCARTPRSAARPGTAPVARHQRCTPG